MNVRRLAVGALASAAALIAGMGTAIPTAQAYGAGGKENVWQVGVSFNCTSPNPDVCGGQTGGGWGWAEFDQPVSMAPNAGDDADAELTGCGHTIGGVGGPGGAGAGHQSISANGWIIGPGSAGPHTFLLTGGTMTFTGQNGPVTLPLTTDGNPPADDGSNLASPTNPNDTGIPADPGHYDTTSIFGFRTPGFAIQVQVAYRPAH